MERFSILFTHWPFDRIPVATRERSVTDDVLNCGMVKTKSNLRRHGSPVLEGHRPEVSSARAISKVDVFEAHCRFPEILDSIHRYDGCPLTGFRQGSTSKDAGGIPFRRVIEAKKWGRHISVVPIS